MERVIIDVSPSSDSSSINGGSNHNSIFNIDSYINFGGDSDCESDGE